MENFDKLLETFMTGDFFLIFLVLMLIILVTLILALIKTRSEYLEMVRREQDKIDLESRFKKPVDETKPLETKVVEEHKKEEELDILDELNSLMATSKEDVMDENKPLVKQIDLPNVKTYDDVIEEYENGEEENAVISTEELEKVARQRMENLGMNDNQVAIQKYE